VTDRIKRESGFDLYKLDAFSKTLIVTLAVFMLFNSVTYALITSTVSMAGYLIKFRNNVSKK
jgi:hypothetical protein